MGNQHCCERVGEDYKPTYQNSLPKKEEVSLLPQKKEEEPISIPVNEAKTLSNKQMNEPQFVIYQSAPPVSPQVEQRLSFYTQLSNKTEYNQQTKCFGNELYVGQLDANNKYPEGYGKIYKSNGSVYLGEWKQGKASGHGVYIMKSGAYYEGNFHDNMAEGQGKFRSGDFFYEGHFIANKFQGIGTEKDENHTFHGDYFQGCKTKGTYTWREREQEYEYIGKFNFRNEFQGHGVLKEPLGIYQGDFLKGEKHGKGIYLFKNGLKYQGEYKHNLKSGKGTLYNNNDSIAYSGQFEDGLPHGIGFIKNEKGNSVEGRWIRGISADQIEKQ